jgi:NADH-quinone oxidoreductase subunit L
MLVLSLLLFLTLYFNFLNSSSSLFVDFGRLLYSYEFFELGVSFAFDHLSLVTSILVIMLTIFAQFFGIEYMSGEAFITRLLYLLLLFSTSVVFLFFVHDFFLILIVWELIGLFSLLLVNFYAIRIYTIKAAFKTYIFSRLSDFFIFIAFFFVVLMLGSTDLTTLFVNTPFLLFFNVYIFNLGFGLLNLLALSIVLAGAIKAAQFPFHV